MRDMKDSGIAWIGMIPDTWKIGKVKDIFIRKNEKANEENPVVLSLARSGVKIRDISTGEGQLAENYSNYNPVEINDLLLNPMDLYSGANCSISKVKGVISPAYINLRAKGNNNPSYYDYFFKTQYWGMVLFAHGKGVSFDNRWTLGLDTALNYNIPIPSELEQEKIATFLDKKIAEIDNVIEKTKETIEDYKKYKQSIIAEIVTKGLNQNVEMKESGVESIGKIPSHWKLLRNKFVAKSLIKGSGITKEDVKVDGNIQCVRYGEIYSKYDNYFSNAYSRTNIDSINNPTYISAGDLLFAGTGELVEEIGKNILYEGNNKCLAGGDIIVMKHNQNARFINYALNSISSQEQKSKGKAKLKVVHISASDIGNIIVAIPPIAEQEKIADYLDRICKETNLIIDNKKKMVEELEEYKKSLIYEYVTGKKEVV